MNKESIYWFIVFLTFLYVIYKNRSSSTKILVILCFYSGLAAFSGKSIENLYKIILVFFSIILLIKHEGLNGLTKKGGFLLIAFVLFSISFLYSGFINKDYFNLLFSQYGKYVTPVCLFFIFNRILGKNPNTIIPLKELFFSLLMIQIILTVVKLFTIGMQETTVGSIAYIGGGPATILPVLGFILLWIFKEGDLKRKDWIYTLFLFLIGIVSFKRAILFILPVFVFLFMYYVPRKLRVRHLIFILPSLLFLFYIGVRLNPTLNKEGKIGGSFNFNFVIEYAQSYNFGISSESSSIQLGQGRGGATLLLFSKLFSSQPLSTNDIWGTGLKEVYTTDYEQFESENFEVNSKGSLTGVYQTYLTAGFIGVFLTILLLTSITGLVLEPRIRIVLALLLFWDYLFYSGLILRTQALLVLLFFVIIYSNLDWYKYSFQKPDDQNGNLQIRSA